MTKQEFVHAAYETARKSAATSGLPPLVTVAQAALESGWGQSQLSQQANNFFGIKAHGKQPYVCMSTAEMAHGVTQQIEAAFARYGSMFECFERRDAIVSKSPIYAQARQHADDEVAFIHELAKHWATDSHYAAKLTAVLGEVKGIVGDVVGEQMT